jgi:DnaK suppressor protein
VARQNALLRLRKTLQARRADLRKALADEVKNLRDLDAADATGDSADAAFEAESDVVSSQLAQLDSRELSQIERALARLEQGKYGICENCEKKIPLTRLNALLYATLCINCERKMEKYPGWEDRSGKGNWDKVIDSDASTGDQGINSPKWKCARRAIVDGDSDGGKGIRVTHQGKSDKSRPEPTFQGNHAGAHSTSRRRG